MKTGIEKGLNEFKGILFRMLDGKEVFFEADNDFKTEMLPLLNKEEEIARFNAEHPDQYLHMEYLTKEQIMEKYGKQIPESLIDKMKTISDRFNAIEVFVENKWSIKQGDVWIFDSKLNGFPETIGGQKTILGWLIKEKDSDDVYEIVGVENFATGDMTYPTPIVSVLVKLKK